MKPYIFPTETKIIFSDNVRVKCTKCGRIKPIHDVGLRRMGDGIIRNQAQCAKCRGKT